MKNCRKLESYVTGQKYNRNVMVRLQASLAQELA